MDVAKCRSIETFRPKGRDKGQVDQSVPGDPSIVLRRRLVQTKPWFPEMVRLGFEKSPVCRTHSLMSVRIYQWRLANFPDTEERETVHSKKKKRKSRKNKSPT
ncbi:hypothetical protein TNIN_13211 [Trichonephila inaurata madagascariensis]|uniref:Uncharacterized protein n=1 Tax=Trichonephila inaurata madagascariensis TaxID=2747483 RepID=A0A8X6YNU6_9ARAC|nr:hypothetical protein TNIN_13211 [Trichonephila inaurata madagascariensis]